MAEPALGFEVPGQLYYLHLGINEPFRGTPSPPKAEESALAAITKLLETYPITPPPPTNRQPANPNRKAGTIELPLWQTTSMVHPNSPHWPAYQAFIQAITPVIDSASSMLRAHQEANFLQARVFLVGRNADRDAQDPSKSLPQYSIDNCFETLKLSANMALPLAPLTTSHRSPWIFISLCGAWVGGMLDFGDLQGVPKLQMPGAGDALVVREVVPVGGKLFAGDKYQLELFLPDV